MKIKVGHKEDIMDAVSYMMGKNDATAKRVKAALDKLNKSAASPTTSIVIALVPSSKKDKPPYKIRLAGNAVLCPCDGFRYRNQCRHMERFKEAIAKKPLKLK